jgi:hypothetical protein
MHRHYTRFTYHQFTHLSSYLYYFYVPTDFLPFDTVHFTNIADFTFYSMYLVRLYPIHIDYFHVYHSYQDSILPFIRFFLDLGFLPLRIFLLRF